MTRQLIPILLIAAATFGCGKDDEPTNNDTGTANGMTSDMGSENDASGESDTGAPNSMNSQTDMGQPPPDMAQAADTGTDMTTTADMATPDMPTNPDMSMPDMTETSDGCAPGATRHEEVAGAVVACEGFAASLNQCDAAAICGAGWHMCTATEYRSHFEAVEPAAAANANFWIASCIRDGADPIAPTDLVCADCTGTQTGTSLDVAFSCVNAITVETDQLYVGVRSGTACTFAGENVAGNDAYWNAQPSTTLQAGAFCCID